MTEALLKNNLYTLFGNGRAEKNLDTNKNIKSSYASFARYVHCISFFCMLETIVCSSETTLDTVPIDVVELNDIKINDNEKELIDALKKFCENRGIWGDQEVVPRIAGGWVRDKLLGTKSNDIDIALDTISGYDFAKKFSESNLINCSLASQIKSNPKKQKFITSTTTKILGLQVDFVQLHTGTEETTRVATAYEDASRRDFTINSLFYNIMTGKIEDYTNGREDIKDKILRTPTDAKRAFLGDPFRVLRVLRFHSRLGFAIDQGILDAMRLVDDSYEAEKRDEIDARGILRNTIDTQRKGTEIQKTFNLEDGYNGMLLLVEYGLLDVVFKASNYKNGSQTKKRSDKLEASESKHIDDSKDDADKLKISMQFVNDFTAVGEVYKIDRSIFNLYTCLLHYIGQKDGNQYINAMITDRSLKLNSNFTNRIKIIEKYYEELAQIPDNDYKLVFMLRKMKSDWLNIFVLRFILTKDIKYLQKIDEVQSKGYDRKLNEQSIMPHTEISQVFGIKDRDISKYMECLIVHQIINGRDDKEKLIECVKKHFELLKLQNK